MDLIQAMVTPVPALLPASLFAGRARSLLHCIVTPDSTSPLWQRAADRRFVGAVAFVSLVLAIKVVDCKPSGKREPTRTLYRRRAI